VRHCGVTEELGSEIIVIVTIDAPHIGHASLAQARWNVTSVLLRG
jgi:hypothetical protein